MKKVLSVLLAVMMMFAVMVPAFAAKDPTNVTTAPTDTVIKVSTTDKDGNGDDVTWFEVTIPADIVIPWGGTGDATYKVAAQLKTAQKLTVAIASADNKMSSAAGETLDFTITNNNLPAGPVIGTGTAAANTKVDFPATINVTTWEGKPIDTYSDQLTYTVTVA